MDEIRLLNPVLRFQYLEFKPTDTQSHEFQELPNCILELSAYSLRPLNA